MKRSDENNHLDKLKDTEPESKFGHYESFRYIKSPDPDPAIFRESNAKRCNYSTKIKRK